MLIDDHTRFKFVYFLKNKSEAAKKAAEFVAQFNHAASSKSVSPIRVVGHLHITLESSCPESSKTFWMRNSSAKPRALHMCTS